MATYWLADGNTRRGPFPSERLVAEGMRPDTLVWAEGMAQWTRADAVPDLRECFAGNAPENQGGEIASPPPAAVPLPSPQPMPYAQPAYGAPGTVPYPATRNNNRVAAGICGILLGWLGIHKFVLGYTGAGLTMLLVSILTCGFGAAVMHVIGIIEGIIYLTKSDDEFYQTYVVGQKSWF